MNNLAANASIHRWIAVIAAPTDAIGFG